jgi:hypothetical protein
LTGVNVYRDLNKNPSVAITPEDAAVITQNLKIIQDWQKDPANQAALTPELKNRIENIIKGVASVGVPTAQAATPATPASAPAATPAVNPKVNQINQTLDSMDQLLKKNNFESVSNKKSPPLTEAEHMSRLRNIVTEDWTDKLPDWDTIGKIGAGAYAANLYNKFKKPGTPPVPPGAPAPPPAPPPPPAPSLLKSLLLKAGTVLKVGGTLALLGITAKILYTLYDDLIADPVTAKKIGVEPQEAAQIKQLNDQLIQLVGDGKDLPPDVQQKITSIQQRIVKLGERFELEKQADELSRIAKEKRP